MWLTKLTIITWLLLATGYGQRTRTPPTRAPGKAGAYFAELQAEASEASSQRLLARLLVVPRKGKGRSFIRNFGEASMKGGVQIAVEDTYNNSRGITVVTTTKAMLESVKKQVHVMHLSISCPTPRHSRVLTSFLAPVLGNLILVPCFAPTSIEGI